MAKAKSSRHRRGPDQVALEQFVQCDERVDVGDLRDGGENVGLKRLAGNRCHPQQRLPAGGERGHLARQRRGYGRRDVASGRPLRVADELFAGPARNA